MYSQQDIIDYVEEEDVKFIRLSFIDVYGKQKNISIQPNQLKNAFTNGITFNGAAIAGFQQPGYSDLLLKPDPDTMAVLPWRSFDGTVIRMYCKIYNPDGTLYEKDPAQILRKAVSYAKKQDITVQIGNEFEFYLFKEDGQPLDMAGYMDISPEDQGEDVRRQICHYLSRMNIDPEASHHEQGPGQNQIDFRYDDPVSSAQNVATFRWIVETVAESNGLVANFEPKPIIGQPGNSIHMHISTNRDLDAFMAGVLAHIKELTLFLNPSDRSYTRLAQENAPKYISWGHYNRNTLIRIPAGKKRMELRSPDPDTNCFLAYALIIYAGLDGIEKHMQLMPETAENTDVKNSSLETLPATLEEAKNIVKQSDFIAAHLPKSIIEAFI